MPHCPKIYQKKSSIWSTQDCENIVQPPQYPGDEIFKKNFYHSYFNSGIFFRGNDGQHPYFYNEIQYFIDNWKLDDANAWLWDGILPNMAPPYSATLISRNAYAPILWYNPGYNDPFWNNANPGQSTCTPLTDAPEIFHRTNLGVCIDNFLFFGCSLFDGDSNDNIQGGTTIPPARNFGQNRGNPTSSWARDYPYKVLPGSTYSPPGTYNTMKSTNPGLTINIDGTPIGNKTETASNIIKKFTSIKGGIWKRWIEIYNDEKKKLSE